MTWFAVAAARRQTVSKISGSTAKATATATSNSPAAMFFNQTPTLSWYNSSPGQSSSGVVTGSLYAADGDGDPLALAVTSGPTRGTVTITEDGAYNYTPFQSFAFDGTTDTFTVAVSDEGSGFHLHGIGGLLNFLTFGLLGSSGHTATVTVPITVTAWQRRNSAPTATVSVGVPDAMTGTVVGQIAGADPDGDSLSYSAPATTTKGAVNVNPLTGAFTYTPTATARQNAATIGASTADKADSFTVTINDGRGGTTSVAVSVVISPKPPNSAPTAGTTTVGSPDASTAVVKGSVFASDADNDTLSYTGSATTAKGQVVVAANGSFEYMPTIVARHNAAADSAPTADKTDTFTVTVADGKGGVKSIPVTVPISPSNNAPTRNQPGITSPDRATGRITVTDVALDADGDVLTISGPTSTTKGMVKYNTNGTITYTPSTSARIAAGLSLTAVTDSFQVTVKDGHGGLITQTISVPITGNWVSAFIKVGANPDGVIFSPNGNRAYVVNTGSDGGVAQIYTPDGWVSSSLPGSTEGNSIPLDYYANGSSTNAVALSSDGSKMVVSHSYFYAGGGSERTGLPSSVINLTGSGIFVVNAPAYSYLDVQEAIKTGNLGTRPFGLVFSPDDTRLYVAIDYGTTNGQLAVIDTATRAFTKSITVGPAPRTVAITPNGKFVYVANTTMTNLSNNPIAGENTISVVDTTTNTVVATLNTGKPAESIKFTSDGKRAYIAGGGQLTVVDTVSNGILSTLSVSTGAVGVALSPNGSRAYVAGSGGVAVIDTATNRIIQTIDTGPYYSSPSNGYQPTTPDGSNSLDFGSGVTTDIAISPDGTYLYVSQSSGSYGRIAVVSL